MTDLLWTLADPQVIAGPLLLAGVAVALAVESALLLGLVIPGTTIALTLGAVAQTGTVGLGAAIATVSVGAISGGQLGYQAGRRPRSKSTSHAVPQVLIHMGTRLGSALEQSLRNRPATAIAAAQWLSSGRVLMPRAAGRSQVSHRRFTAAHTPAGLAWAAAMTTLGYTVTAATRDVVALGLGLAAGAAVVLALVLLRRFDVGHQRRARPRSACASSRPPASRRAACAPTDTVSAGGCPTGCTRGPAAMLVRCSSA